MDSPIRPGTGCLAKRFRISAYALFLLMAAHARGQSPTPQPDETLPGFKAESVLEARGIDNVSPFSGDPGVVLPLGREYTLSTAFKWQLKAYYSAKFWNLNSPPCPADPNTPGYRWAFILGDPTLGVGWSLQLGYVVFDPLETALTEGWTYFSPDGGRHAVGLGANNTGITTDGSHLRVMAIGGTKTAPTYYTVEFPDGTIEYFEQQFLPPRPVSGASSPDFSNLIAFDTPAPPTYGFRYGLTRVQDRFRNNVLLVKYDKTNVWQVQSIVLDPDSMGNGPTIQLNWSSTFPPAGATVWSVLDSVVFPEQGSQTRKVSFKYQLASFDRNPYDTAHLQTGPCQVTQALVQNAPLLQQITYSDPALTPSFASFFYTFDYIAEADASIFKGTLKTITLPTGGTIQYTYAATTGHNLCEVFPGGCDPESSSAGTDGIVSPESVKTFPPNITPFLQYLDSSAAVASRIETDPLTQKVATTTYDRMLIVPCPDSICRSADDSRLFRRVTTVEPGNDSPLDGATLYAHRSYFTVSPANVLPPVLSGLEVNRRDYAGATDTGTPVRTLIRCYGHTAPSPVTFPKCGYRDGSGKLDGSQLQQYGLINFAQIEPPATEATWYGAVPGMSDGGTCSGSTPCTSSANTPLSFNDTVGQYGSNSLTSTLPPVGWSRTTNTVWNPQTQAGGKWMLDIISSKSVLDASTPAPVTVATTFNFDLSNGRSGGFLNSISSTDTTYGTKTETFTADGNFNPAMESAAASGSGMSATTYTDTWTFQSGLALAQRRTAPTGVSWKSFDVDRDTNTGLIATSRDTNPSLVTSYSYDALGRLKTVAPPGGEAQTVISYDNPNETTVSRSSGDGSTWQRYTYDGLGRLSREIRQMPSGYSVRSHGYDAAGHANFVSEWAPCGSSTGDCLTVTPAGTTSAKFDPFGRAQRVTVADGNSTTIDRTDGAISFSDSLETVTTCINASNAVTTSNPSGACQGPSAISASTTTRKDALGRVISVTEPGNVTTGYGYNVLDKLASVAQSSGSQTQNRLFVYDALGFLRSETTPEQGTVTYTQYDALGNLIKSKEPNNVTLTRAYSAAGRLTGLTSDEAGSPTYLTNAWNDNGTGASLGRLTSRMSKTVTAGGGGSVTATETMTYDPGTGRLASRSLGFAPGATGLGTSWSYNSLGLIANTSNSVAGQETGKVSYGYSAGYPTTVSGEPAAGLSAQLAGNVSYTPYGGLSSIGLGNATTTQIASDPSLLPRPSSISNGSWSTGAYAYDGCGNILSIGSDSYRYDSVSRLISSTVQSQAQTFAYDRWGNMTQKGLQSFTIDPTKNQLSYQAGVVEYDLLGNLKTYGPQRFTYDTLSRQTDFTNNGVVTESYVYDGAGERVARFAAAPALPPLMILNDTVESYCTSSLPITITLLASGGAGPPYTWTATGLTNGATLTSGGILTLPNAGTYSLTVTVKDSANNTLSASLTITVSTNCDGIFDNEPQDAIICPGGVYSASALAHYGDGTYAASYTWKTYVGKSWVAASGTTTPCSFAGGLLTGSCFSAYPSQSPTYYQVTATKSGGTGATSSRIATVSVGGAIQITHSQNDLLCAGQEVNLSDLFTAMGCNLSTTWQQKNADGSWSNLSNDLVSPTQTTFYRAVLQADEPPQTVNSPSIEVDVLPQPVLTQAPASQNVCAGSPVTLSATANTSGNFKWEHYDGKKWIQDKYNVNPTTSDSATLTPAQTAPYRVSVTTYCGVYTGNFTLTQVTLPTVSGIAPSLTICPPQAVSYAATVSGATSLQWQQSSDGVNWSNIAGATSAAYTTPVLTNTTLNQVSYRCRLSATNSCGTTYASSVITVQPQPQASITGSACSVAAGQPTTLTCTASDFSPQYSWSPGGQTTPSITVSPTTTTTYTCYVREATTGCNSTAASYVVTVGSQVNSPVITANPVSQTICSGSSSAALSGAATGTNVAYQWQKQNADSSWSNVSGATSSTYVAPAVNATYRMAASNACGSVYSAPATVTVDASKQSAAITVQPQSVYYCKGGSATLSVGATGTALSYRWESSTDRSFWSPVVGGGSATINVAPTSVIYYHVVVWNVCDTVTSNVVTATQVPSAPTITTQPAGGAICGSGYAMHVATSADFLGATYQWQVSSGSWTNIAGATSNSYTATAAGGYRVIVTDACGSVTSNQALVSVGTMPGQPTIAGDSFIYSGQSAHLTISNARFDWAYAYWSDGQVTTPPFDRYVSPTTTTSYSVYVTGPSYSCPSPSSAPFQVTVGGGNGALYGGYQSGSTTSGESPAQTSSVAAAGTIVLLHAAPDGKSNKTLSVVRSPGDRILAGDWNGDGVGSLGFYDPTTGRFELWDGDPTGAPTYRFIFGPPGRFQPIVGDWDGDGIDTIGLYDAQTGRVWLKNQNAPGAPDAGYVFRLPFKNGIAIAGDWTGQGYDTVGVYDPQESVFYLKDSHKSGGPDHAVSFGPKAGGALPMSGDWNAQGLSAIGLYDGKTGRVYLRKTLTSGPPEYTQTFVPGLDQVFAGRWDALKHAPGPSARKVAVPVERPSSDSWPPSAPSTQSQRVSVAWPPSGWLAEAAWGGEGADSDQDAGGFQLAAYHSNRSAAPLSAQAATFTWYYTIRDENNRPSIEYHLNSAGTVVTDRIYAYLGNALIATYETANGTPGWVYYATDHLGSVRSAMASVNCTQAFLPFGEQVSSTCTTPPLKFAGMERDDSSGHDYDHARYTGSTLGRFLSPDKAQGKIRDPQTWNRYAYARNNPVKFVDRNGLEFGSPGGGAELHTAVLKFEATYHDSEPAMAALGQSVSLKETLGPVGTTIVLVSGAGPAVKLLSQITTISTAPVATKKETGSYTVTFESGNRYHGKGPETRADASAARVGKENADAAKDVEWKPAENDREAFKAEAERIRDDGGVKNPENYNKINSPGKKYLEEDQRPPPQ